MAFPRPGLLIKGSVLPTALINGAQTFLTLNVPNDGVPHSVLGSFIQDTTAALTGGGVNMNYVGNGLAISFPLIGVAAPVGVVEMVIAYSFDHTVDPNTTVTITQNTPITAGAATLSGLVAIL